MKEGRIGDPSKMAAAQYVSSNRQRKSMGRLPIYVYGCYYTAARGRLISKRHYRS